MSVEDRIKDYAAGKPKRRRKKEWEPPSFGEFLDGAVLAYDQGAFCTGWCYFWKSSETGLVVLDKGVFKEPPVPGLKSHADTLQRATWMAERIQAHIHEQRLMPSDLNEFWIVHEMPPIQGWRPEVSLMGALAIRLATERSLHRVVSVANQHMRSVLVGSERNDGSKRVVKEALARYGRFVGDGWNEHNRDALALGLTFLYDEKRRTDESR